MVEELLRRATEREINGKISDITEFYVDVTRMSDRAYRSNGATEEEIQKLWEEADQMIADQQGYEARMRRLIAKYK